MKSVVSLLLLATGLFGAAVPLAFAKDSTSESPKVIGMYFYANWCANCKELEPKLETAANSLKKDPFLLVRLDVSNKATQYKAGLTASAMGLGSRFDANAPKTGFVLLVDPKSGEVVDRLTKELAPDEIEQRVRGALAKAG